MNDIDIYIKLKYLSEFVDLFSCPYRAPYFYYGILYPNFFIAHVYIDPKLYLDISNLSVSAKLLKTSALIFLAVKLSFFTAKH